MIEISVWHQQQHFGRLDITADAAATTLRSRWSAAHRILRRSPALRAKRHRSANRSTVGQRGCFMPVTLRRGLTQSLAVAGAWGWSCRRPSIAYCAEATSGSTVRCL